MNNILRYQNYTATIAYSGEDAVFFGKVAGLNDLIIFEAASIVGLKKAFKDAIDDYVIASLKQ